MTRTTTFECNRITLRCVPEMVAAFLVSVDDRHRVRVLGRAILQNGSVRYSHGAWGTGGGGGGRSLENAIRKNAVGTDNKRAETVTSNAIRGRPRPCADVGPPKLMPRAPARPSSAAATAAASARTPPATSSPIHSFRFPPGPTCTSSALVRTFPRAAVSACRARPAAAG